MEEHSPQGDMTEHEWFAIAWSQEQLKEQYHDASIDKYRREHAFYRYWKKYLDDNESEAISRSELEEIVAFRQWEAVVGDLLGTLAAQSRLSSTDCQWLLGILPEGTWVVRQIRALLLLRDDTTSWQEKLEMFLQSGTDWAIVKMCPAIPPAERAEAQQRIDTSNRPKRSKRFLREALDRA